MGFSYWLHRLGNICGGDASFHNTMTVWSQLKPTQFLNVPTDAFLQNLFATLYVTVEMQGFTLHAQILLHVSI